MILMILMNKYIRTLVNVAFRPLATLKLYSHVVLDNTPTRASACREPPPKQKKKKLGEDSLLYIYQQ